jgi:hypothetical protein
MQVLELKGIKSLRALNVFHTLMLGLKMLPMHASVPYDVFYDEFHEKPDDEKLKLIRQAAMFVELTREDVEALVFFVADANGKRYQTANINNLSALELLEIVIAVAFEVGNLKIDSLSEEQKKKSSQEPSTSQQ